MTLEAETLITVSADGQLFEGLCPTNLDELEKASVLASTGNLHSKESLKLKDLDLIDVPLNTVNSLTKMIRGDLEFNNVTGMHYSTFDEIKCDTLLVCDMSIPGPLTQEINVSSVVYLRKAVQKQKNYFHELTSNSSYTP